MTDNHPYPKHVMEAVAVAILNYYEYLDGRNTSAVEIANVALTGLWEASKVDDAETIKTLPNDAEIAAAEQRGKAEAWNEAADFIGKEFDFEGMAIDLKEENPYRADQEDDDE